MKPLPEPDDGFRLEPWLPGAVVVKRDFVGPIPVGSYIACVFKVTGYDQDCDGSAMARLEQVNRAGEGTGVTQDCVGLYANCDVVLDSPEELFVLAEGIRSVEEDEGLASEGD